MSTEKTRFQRILDWHEQRLPIGDFLNHSVGAKYPAPKNLNYFWNFGSLAGFMLSISGQSIMAVPTAPTATVE